MIATCRHCTLMVTAPDTGMIVNGEPSREYMRFIEKLARHVKHNHPGQEASTAAALELAGHLAGLTILGNFETADPELKTYRDRVAALLHRIAGRTVPDEALRARSLDLARKVEETATMGSILLENEPGEVTRAVADQILVLLCDLRDVLTYADVPVSLIVKPVDTAPV